MSRKATRYRAIFPRWGAVPHQDVLYYALGILRRRMQREAGDLLIEAKEIKEFALRLFDEAVSRPGLFRSARGVTYASRQEGLLVEEEAKKVARRRYVRLDVQPGEMTSGPALAPQANGEVHLTAQFETQVRTACSDQKGLPLWTSAWHRGTPLTLTLRLEGLE